MKSDSTAVKSTVQAEMQSYSSVVAQKVAEKTDRSQNVMIDGLKEETDKLLQGKVETILAEVGPKPTI